MTSETDREHAMHLAQAALDSTRDNPVGPETLTAVRNGLLTIPAGTGADWYDVPAGGDARPSDFTTRRGMR